MAQRICPMLRILIGAVAILAVAILALAAGPAAAQVALSPFKGQEKRLTPDELAKQKASDSAYRAAMDKIPEKKVTVDPWGNLRSAPSTSAQNKP
jgi:hypothetical protein